MIKINKINKVKQEFVNRGQIVISELKNYNRGGISYENC